MIFKARAKAELREEATKEDALDVIEIMKFSLIDIFTDSCGILDKTRSQNGTGTSSRNQVWKLEFVKYYYMVLSITLAIKCFLKVGQLITDKINY